MNISMRIRENIVVVGERLVQLVPTLLIASFLVYALVALIPGDPAVTLAGEQASAEQVEIIRKEYGLDQPFLVRYVTWLGDVMRGDLSRSMFSTEEVKDGILRRLPNTVLLVTLATTFSLVIGFILGVAAAVRPNSWADTFITSVSSLGIALPSFWLAMILVYFLSIQNHWFPVTGAASFVENPGLALRHAFLPALALSASGIAEVSRQLRSAMIEVLSAPFVLTLRAKGLPERLIRWQHGLRNVAVTMLTVVGLLVNRLIGGAVIIEIMFAIPGLGSYAVSAAIIKDFPVIQGVLLSFIVIAMTTNLIVDVLCRMIDPRLK